MTHVIFREHRTEIRISSIIDQYVISHLFYEAMTVQSLSDLHRQYVSTCLLRVRLSDAWGSYEEKHHCCHKCNRNSHHLWGSRRWDSCDRCWVCKEQEWQEILGKIKAGYCSQVGFAQTWIGIFPVTFFFAKRWVCSIASCKRIYFLPDNVLSTCLL